MYSDSAEFPADMGTVCGADCVRGIIINNTDSKVYLILFKGINRLFITSAIDDSIK